MATTHNQVSQVAFTKPEIAARFALQMAEQTRKFGQRLRERRREVGMQHQKDLVARMVKLGDKGINTNQLSRYENGEGPLPREQRMEWFAEALDTTTADLLAGPVAERRARDTTPDVFGALNGDTRAILDDIRADVSEILARLDAAGVRRLAAAPPPGSDQERLPSSQDPPESESAGGAPKRGE